MMTGASDEFSTPPPEPEPPPRAFTQGVGTVFQFVGVILMLGMLSVCCISAPVLMGETGTETGLERIGWSLPGDAPGEPFYSGSMGITVIVFGGVFFGLALAGLGLGLQAEYRGAPAGAVALSGVGALFWLLQSVFAIQQLRSILLGALGIGLVVIFVFLLGLSITAWREMRRNPPPADHDVLPADYKVPYSHLHQDPPEVRLARELAERRRRLEVERKEIELLEKRLREKES